VCDAAGRKWVWRLYDADKAYYLPEEKFFEDLAHAAACGLVSSCDWTYTKQEDIHHLCHTQIA